MLVKEASCSFGRRSRRLDEDAAQTDTQDEGARVDGMAPGTVPSGIPQPGTGI